MTSLTKIALMTRAPTTMIAMIAIVIKKTILQDNECISYGWKNLSRFDVCKRVILLFVVMNIVNVNANEYVVELEMEKNAMDGNGSINGI